MDVLDQLLVRHADVSNGDGEAEHLLHLELDGGLQVVALGGQVVVMGHQGGELTGLVKSGTKEPGDLLDEGVGSQEGVIALGQLLDLLLVLVQLLQIVGSHAGDALGLGLVAMLLISKNADLELLLGDVTQLDGAGETLVLLGIVVLQTDLEVDGLDELTLLFLGAIKDGVDTLVERLL